MAATMADDRAMFARLLLRDLDLHEYFAAADRALVRVVPFDSSCWLSLDPATLLPTSHFSSEFGSDHLMALAANEYLESDVNKFGDLARAVTPAGILSQATAGQLGRSARYVRTLAPNGYGEGDELRAVFRDGASAWGCVALHRRHGTFNQREAALVARLGGFVAEGIRRAIVRSAVRAGRAPDAPGLLVLRADDSVEIESPAAARWLSEIFDSTGTSSSVPLILRSVANQARGRDPDEHTDVASVRLPLRNGGWLRVDACLPDERGSDRVALLLTSAREPEVATLILDAYGLSAREGEVARLVLQGRSTRQIAEELDLSPYTVQDHVKAIFAKVGVRSRRELVARLFLQQCAPRLAAGAVPHPDGWFVEDGVAPAPKAVARGG